MHFELTSWPSFDWSGSVKSRKPWVRSGPWPSFKSVENEQAALIILSASKRTNGQENVTANRSAVSSSDLIPSYWSNDPVGSTVNKASRLSLVIGCFHLAITNMGLIISGDIKSKSVFSFSLSSAQPYSNIISESLSEPSFDGSSFETDERGWHLTASLPAIQW